MDTLGNAAETDHGRSVSCYSKASSLEIPLGVSFPLAQVLDDGGSAMLKLLRVAFQQFLQQCNSKLHHMLP